MRQNLDVVLGIVALASIAGILLLPALQAATESRPRGKCRSHLKQIGYACQLYAGDNAERFPPSLGALFPGYISDGGVFLCPAAGCAQEIAVDDLPPGAADASGVWHDGFTDYVYVPGLLAGDPPDLVLAHDRHGNHEDGRRVLMIGGTVRWMVEPEFHASCDRTLAVVRERAAASPGSHSGHGQSFVHPDGAGPPGAAKRRPR